MPNHKVNREVMGGQFEARKPKRPAPGPPMLPTGRELLDRINSGEVKQASPEYLETVRDKVTANCEELIEVGARIRPLMVGDKQVGWVRGIHAAERKLLKRWIKDPNDFLTNVLLLATSFDINEIDNLTASEVQSIMGVIRKMSEYDTSLWPFLSAFSTTQVSENLWFSEGTKVTSFENKVVTMPDGRKIKIATPPDHARLWASLCNYREQAKKRLDENWNALLTIRPMAGRSADPLQTELRAVSRQLTTNAMEPWTRVVRPDPKLDVNNGWAHPGDSPADLQREMEGMIRGDRHERVMDAWAQQLEEQEKRRIAALEAKRKKKNWGGEAGVVEEKVTIFTEKELRERQAALRAGLPPPQKSPHLNRDAREVVQSPLDRIRKYR